MTDEKDGELYTRWLQFAAFTPVFRPHGTALEGIDPNVKSIPSEPCFWDEPYKTIVRQSINMRYRLLPYNYTLAYEQAVNGKPLMRPMYYYNFADAEAIKAEDQYYWGDNFLVAPVINKGATTRTLYLPEGLWYNFNTNKTVAGNQSVNEPVDINSIPVFVKEGSFIPMWSPAEEIRSTEQYDSKDITVRYYPSAKPSRYQWFDDDGTSTKTLEKAQYEVVSFSGQMEYSRISITITTNNEPAYRRKQVRKIKLAIPFTDALPKEVRVNGTTVTGITSGTEGSDQLKFFYLPIEFAGKTMKIEMLLK
jgi:oligosaccharide 4-alpha-D-glucosyltransferase